MAQEHLIARLGSWAGYDVVEDWQEQRAGHSWCVLRLRTPATRSRSSTTAHRKPSSSTCSTWWPSMAARSLTVCVWIGPTNCASSAAPAGSRHSRERLSRTSASPGGILPSASSLLSLRSSARFRAPWRIMSMRVAQGLQS